MQEGKKEVNMKKIFYITVKLKKQKNKHKKSLHWQIFDKRRIPAAITSSNRAVLPLPSDPFKQNTEFIVHIFVFCCFLWLSVQLKTYRKESKPTGREQKKFTILDPKEQMCTGDSCRKQATHYKTWEYINAERNQDIKIM